jgi:hypothetical protein
MVTVVVPVVVGVPENVQVAVLKVTPAGKGAAETIDYAS